MKVAFYLVAALFAATGCSHKTIEHPAPRLPFLCDSGDDPRAVAFDRDPEGTQPWLKNAGRAPENLGDLGFVGALDLVRRDLYLDGASTAYLVADAEGHYFQFCTGCPGVEGNRVFLLGVRHWSKEPALVVKEGSASFRFIYDMLWSFADDPRYQISPHLIRKMIESGEDENNLKELMKKPNQPPQRNAGSRPTSDASPLSETPSSLGPRG